MFGSTLAIAFLPARISYRVYKAPMRFLKGSLGVGEGRGRPDCAGDGSTGRGAARDLGERDQQARPDDADQALLDVERGGPPRGVRWQGIYHGQLKAQMIVDLLVGAGQR